MRRREILALFAGMAAFQPVVAPAEQGERTRRVGVLTAGGADNPQVQARLQAFREALQQLGWNDGSNLRLDMRWPTTAQASETQAAQLAALAPDVILATGGSAIEPLLKATRTVPIVFTIVPDPVGSGIVDSLARPGGNATGFMQFEYSLCAKWPELLKQIAPNLSRVGVLRDPAITAGIVSSLSYNRSRPRSVSM